MPIDKEKELRDIIENKYNELSLEDKQIVYKLYHEEESNKSEIYAQLKKLIFKIDPPTPEQFLDPQYGWLPKNVIDSVYPVVRDDFLNIINGSKNYNKISFYGSTRSGKTYTARLLIIYTMIFVHCLREPSLFYNLSPLTDLCIYLISFKFDKTRQLYLQPIYKILEKSERFVKVKFQDKVKEEQERIGYEKIVYSKAALVGEITLASGLQILLGNDNPNEIIGADILQSYISEITFFIDEGGATEELIFQLYTDALERIDATVGNDYLTWVYLDSSANYADSIIERHIINVLQYDKNTYFRWRARWEVRPHKFPKWYKEYNKINKENLSKDTINKILLEKGVVFQVITGDNTIPCQIVTDAKQLDYVSPNLIEYIPIDVREAFETAPLKSTKDIAGRPTSNENKFVQEKRLIENIFSLNLLKNVELMLIANSSSLPEQLLWNQIKEKLFIKNYEKDNQYIIYRAPQELRYIGIDLAFSLKGDIQGFCVLHKEWSIERECVINIIDFCFTIGADDKAINLEAPYSLIMDLRTYASLPIYAVYSDSFQSETAIQFLERNSIKAIKTSTVTSLNPYQYMLNCMYNNTLKSGKNIFLKNNLDSLVCLKRNNKDYIDHLKGPTNNIYNGDWSNSTCGFFAKDLSDAIACALFGSKNHEYIPITIYEEENKRFNKDKNIIKTNVSQAWDKLHVVY